MKIVYIRTSTTEQTPELQLKDISSLVNLDECTCLKEQESAFKSESNRVEMENLKKLIAKGIVTDIYVWALDRLFRNRRKLVDFLTLCKVHQVKIHSFKQGWLESLNNIPEPFNEIVYELMIQILGFIAEEESTVKSARVKNAVKKTAQGVTMSYKGNKWGRKPLSKQTITKVHALRKQGMSIREIASTVKIYDSNNNGRNISKSTVQKILVDSQA